MKKLPLILLAMLSASTIPAQAKSNLAYGHDLCMAASRVAASALDNRRKGIPLSTLVASIANIKPKEKVMSPATRAIVVYTMDAYDAPETMTPDHWQSINYQTCMAEFAK
ncbi:MAG: hypothetical protein PHW53_05225 [Patescibacteria group bacterium]|nr:hypothetical protein [Patescibacteria group bacterium]